MQISTLATLNSAQSINLHLTTQLSQDANSFENELEKENLVQQNLVATPNQTQTSPNLNEFDLSSENFF